MIYLYAMLFGVVLAVIGSVGFVLARNHRFQAAIDAAPPPTPRVWRVCSGETQQKQTPEPVGEWE